jgi:hypothetical protein
MSYTFWQTTDGRYRQVDASTWWDTTGVDLVTRDVVDAYLDLAENLGVGMVLLTESIH